MTSSATGLKRFAARLRTRPTECKPTVGDSFALIVLERGKVKWPGRRGDAYTGVKSVADLLEGRVERPDHRLSSIE